MTATTLTEQPSQRSMTQEAPTIDFEVVRLLTQTALLASWGGAHEEATTIAAGCSAWCPDVAQIHNTQALVHFGAGQHEEAVSLLTRTNEKFPDDEMTKAIMGFVLKQLNRPSWQTYAEAVESWGEDYGAVWLARHTLGLNPDPRSGAT